MVEQLPAYLAKGMGTGALSAAIQKQNIIRCMTDGAIFGAASAVGNFGATNLGEAYNYGEGQIGYVQHKLGHMALGSALGAIISKDRLKGPLIGGLSAGGAEIVAEALMGDVQAQVIDLREAGFTDDQSRDHIMKLARFNGEFSKLAAASIAAISNNNVTTALFTASNAVENNFIPQSVAYGVTAGLAAYTVYDVYDTYKTEGAEAALSKAGIEAATIVVGGAIIKRGFTVAGVAYTNAEAAWAAHVATNPRLMKLVEATAPAFRPLRRTAGFVAERAAALNAAGCNSALGRRLAQFDLACEQLSQRGANAVAGLFERKGLQAETSNLASLDLANTDTITTSKLWNKSEYFTYRGQTNRVYQRDDLIDLSRRDVFGNSNLDLMRQGRAPIGNDGRPINLHHMLQTQNSPLAELTETFHHQYHRVIHINPSSIPSGIDRNMFNQWRAQYWIERSKGLEIKK